MLQFIYQSTGDIVSVGIVSIHLMLQFIRGRQRKRHPVKLFQYISCCSLSLRVYDKRLEQLSFNTSHVVVYLARLLYDFPRQIMFQYISCCSLSGENMGKNKSSNRFNTSHVVVYLSAENTVVNRFLVSIHLMLQFILTTMSAQLQNFVVSIHLMLQFIGFTHKNIQSIFYVSIHLMLQFIIKILIFIMIL